ncbi:hypothetical protein [Pseudomonas ogarae]|uniref:hypothetical protein n=1 Tax=Pseudomonas ogarae (strain DSM 112162 / CECT 30235 / F113) TaxID=1114970 RepID=UPI001951B65E|nr:hypothetical protein [Pseudomonas ogarae]
MNIDIGELMDSMKEAAKTIISADLTSVRGFAERQLKSIAKQSALVASGIASGEIEEDEKDFFLDTIENMIRNFANTLRGLIAVTIEKLWNALVGVVWKAISSATGVVLFVVPASLI